MEKGKKEPTLSQPKEGDDVREDEPKIVIGKKKASLGSPVPCPS